MVCAIVGQRWRVEILEAELCEGLIGFCLKGDAAKPESFIHFGAGTGPLPVFIELDPQSQNTVPLITKLHNSERIF
jgi:hypothetical protein